MCLALAGLWMWVAANITPFLTLRYQGASASTYLAGGVEVLWGQGFYLLASLVFVTGILAPLLDLAGIALLLAILRSTARPPGLNLGIRFLRVLGLWTMPGILLVGVLVAAVKMGEMASLQPGPGFVALIALVVLWTSVHASLDFEEVWEMFEGKG